MNLRDLSEIYRFKMCIDECGDMIAPGRNGHLYTDRGKLMYCLTDDGRKPFKSRHLLINQKEKLADITTCKLECDYEAIFELTDQAPGAIRRLMKAAGVKIRRTCTPEQLAHLATMRSKLPQNSISTGA